MKIVVTSVLVDDQDKALRFYTDVLGFVKKTEIPAKDTYAKFNYEAREYFVSGTTSAGALYKTRIVIRKPKDNARFNGLVLAESLMLATLGGFAGLSLAWIIASRGSPLPAMLPVFYLPVRYVLIGVLLVIGLGLVAGILPAVKAMRLRIADALRR